MNQELGTAVPEEEERDRRPFILLLMGLAGILTIALIVSADQTYAGIDGLRALTAYPPASEQDPAARPAVPFLTGLSGLLEGIRELPILGLAPAPTPDGSAAAGGTQVSTASPTPRSGVALPSEPAAPSQPPLAQTPAPGSLAPAGPSTPPSSLAPAPTPPASSTPGPSVTPSPAPSATPTPGPTATPTPTPSATPTPTLAVSTDRGAAAVVTLAGLVPGDTISRTITVKNTGSLGFRYVVSATQTASSALWTDTANGLQLTVAAFDGTILYSGPLSLLGSLATGTTLNAGDTELLSYTFAFPVGAPNAFQALLQDLTLVFTATQYP